ncbi:pentapeptide repeat-containing protein [Thalassospira profundimaris]|uniref:pentapeptide repeat-containing protein n=1 Tax=Thalassospira profundimaris TaxID=502049 RepID=UPI000DED851F|nr:pentapeptide repeat-containing protein [Thalassospira profundimaris]
MTIPFEKPVVSRDWVRSLMHGMLAAIEAGKPTGPNIHTIVLRLNDAVKELAGKESDTPPNRAWNWAARTLTYAASDILAQAQRLAPLTVNKEDAIKTFLEASMQFDDGDAQLDQTTLRAPVLSPVFKKAREALPDLLLTSTTGHNLELDTLQTRFDRALQSASNRVICENPTYFKPLEDALVSIGGEAARREADWARHNFWISSQFTDEPVFSPDADETVPLAAVYLRLRCFWNEDIAIETDDREREEIKRTAHVSNLHETLHDWLKGDARKDAVRVIAGGPGCGKSSFARAFAHEVAQKPNEHRVALIRLQYTHLTGQLDQDIATYFRKFNSLVNPKGNPGLPESPLEWRKADATPLLLIFDGLDELTADAGDAEKYARDFLLSLTRMLSPLNNDSPPVRAVVLGRNIACEQAMKAANLPLPTMLNVAPIAPMTRQTCLLDTTPFGPFAEEDENKHDLFDPENLMQIDQRETYWQQWAYAKGLDANNIPEPVTHKSMSALNLEPLLLHLLINSKYCGAKWQLAADNRNLVYEDILEKIYERNKGKEHSASHNLSCKDFFDLMEVLGLAAWRGNGRTGDEKEFLTVRKRHLHKEGRFKSIHAASLKSVALNIHTRPGGNSDDDGFEFIHKSFGEFLTARGLLSHARRLADKVVEDEDLEQLAEQWSELIKGAELTPYIIEFLYDEARHRLTPTKAVEIKEGLTEMLNWVIEHGLPVPKAFSILKWRTLETYQRCAESALLATASASACIIPIDQKKSDACPSPTIDINTKIFPDSAIAFVSRLTFARHMVARSVFSRINLRGADLIRIDLSDANLSGANLSGAFLFQANLSGAHLIDANLSWADLSGADLHKTDLRGADLSAAHLIDANLSAANLRGANLHGADLCGADLRGADLSAAHLIDANLSAANLRGANLHGADLCGVRGRGADLSAAHLIDANLSAANLSAANLRGANLRGTDLRRADLRGAFLNREDLEGLDLKGAILIEAEQDE